MRDLFTDWYLSHNDIKPFKAICERARSRSSRRRNIARCLGLLILHDEGALKLSSKARLFPIPRFAILIVYYEPWFYRFVENIGFNLLES